MLGNNDFDTAIFDLDGTLVDSNRVWEKIDRQYLRDHRLHVEDRELMKMASMTYEECAEFLISKGIDTDAQTLEKEFMKTAAAEYRHNIMLKPYAAEYLELLRSMGKKIALATASPRELYEPVLRHNFVYKYFDAFATTKEAGAEKTSPDVYLLAASRTDTEPERCVVFEDVLNGIFSASEVGMMTVAVYDKYSEQDVVTMRNSADRFIMDFSEMMR